MNVRTSRRDGVTVVTVEQLTINYADLEKLQEELFAIIDGDVTGLVLDLSSVSAMDSFSVGVLMSAHRRMRRKGGVMKLAAVQPRVRSTLAIAKVDTVIEIHEDVAAACTSFSAGGSE